MKNKKVITLLIIIVLLIGLIVTGVISYSSFIKNKEEIDSNNSDIEISTQLLNDFKEGKLTTDEYVRYNLYAEYDSSLLSKKYSNSTGSQVAVHVEELIDEYYDELSEETKKYFVEKVNLDNVTFELDKENQSNDNKVAIADLIIDQVYAKEEKITNLNKAVLSKNKNFVVWYTTSGDSATNYDTAKKVADGLEDTIKVYNGLSNYKYKFKSNYLTKGKTYENQLAILKSENINTKYLDESMQVYLINYNHDSLAQYISGYGKGREIIDSIKGGDKYGTIVYPYIIVKPSAVNDYERLNQIYNHELFHHYQYNVLCGKEQCSMKDNYIGEATANWASSLATKKTTSYGFLNEWAGTARKFSSNLLSDEWVNKYGEEKAGYALFVYLNYYDSKVENGVEKIINSIYENNALEYLQKNATKEELNFIQRDISLSNLKQEFNNNNLKVDLDFGSTITLINTFYAEDKVEEKNISRLGMDYYLLDVSSDVQMYEITLGRDNANISATIIGVDKNDDYILLENAPLAKENFVFDTNFYDEYERLYIVVYNILPSLNNYYSLSIDKTNRLTESDINNMIDINHKLSLNGFEFELGVGLDDFVENTGAILDEESFAKAKANSETLAGLYYEVEATIMDGDNEIVFNIFIKTKDLNNITVQGISFSSDRGSVESNSGFLAYPNLVTCGFEFLNGMDIDKTTFHDIPKILQSQSDRHENEYTTTYELKLKDNTGFGIEIWFSNEVKNKDVYYITYVNVTNSTGLTW